MILTSNRSVQGSQLSVRGFTGWVLYTFWPMYNIMCQEPLAAMGEKAAIAGTVIRHAGVIAGCVLFVPLVYGLGILSGIVSIESTGHSPGIAAVFMLALPITVPPPTLVIVGSLLIPGETPHSVIPRIVVTKGLFVALGITLVIAGPFIGIRIWWFYTGFHAALTYTLFLLLPYIMGIISITRGTEVYRQPTLSPDY